MDRGPDLVGATLGQYHIEALIGQGGMGYVYRARDTTLARSVALKILPPEVVGDASRLSRFVQEARAASALNHPHVIAIHEIREAAPMRDGAAIPGLPALHYLAMELVTGDTLRTLIETRRLDMKRAIELLVQVAEAFSAAHAAGVVHYDLKPENIMVASSGYAKVLDFGLAKLRRDVVPNDGATQAATVTAASAQGILLGTVGYMSPEQVDGRPTDHRSDVFSFGCVLYEAVAGSRAFAGPSTIETLHRIANVDPAVVVSGLTSAPPELRRIVGKCLAKDPEDRYQSMKDAAIDLRGLLRLLGSGSAVTAETPRPSASAGRWLLWLGAAGLAVAVGVIAWTGWLRREPTAAVAPGPITIERITTAGFLTHVALSPDGKYLAYTENPGGKQSLVGTTGGRNESHHADSAASGGLLGPCVRAARWDLAVLRDQEHRGSRWLHLQDSVSWRRLDQDRDGRGQPSRALSRWPATRLAARRFPRAWRERADDCRQRRRQCAGACRAQAAGILRAGILHQHLMVA